MKITQLSRILAACTVVQALQTLRTNAEWTVSDNSYDGITWLDQNQTMPTKDEVTTAISQCQTAATARAALKAQARLDVKNNTLTQAQRLQALVLLLDLDK